MTRTNLTRLAATAALSLIAHGAAVASHPQHLYDLYFQHSPTGTNDSVIRVELDAEGHWTQIHNPRWRFTVGASWSQPPTEYEWILINVKHESTVWHIDNVFQINLLKNHGIASVGEPVQHYTFAVPYAYAVHTPGDGIGTQPHERCFARRAEALEGGASLNKVLSEGFTIELGMPVRADLSVKYKGGQEMHVARKEIPLPVTIHCEGNPQLADLIDPPPWQPADIASPFEVVAATLVPFLGNSPQPLGPGEVSMTCPVELNLKGTLTTAGMGPGEVKYRFRWAHGATSTVFTRTITSTAEAVEIAHSVPIPLPGAVSPGPQGGDAGGTGGAGGFAQVQQSPPPPGPLPEAVPEPSQDPGPAIIDQAGSAGNVHKDSVWLEVLSPGTLHSNYAAYHIVCEPTVTKGIGGPGGMAVPATPPLPARDGGLRERTHRPPAGIAPAAPRPEGDPARPVIRGSVPNPTPVAPEPRDDDRESPALRTAPGSLRQ